MCLLGEIVLSFFAYSSSVQGTFNILSLIINDRKMKLKHSTIEMRILLKGNNLHWSDIIDNAAYIYMECRCKTKQDERVRKTSKRKRISTLTLKTFISNSQTKNKVNKIKKKNFKLNIKFPLPFVNLSLA